MKVADHCPIERPLISEKEEPPLQPAVPSVSSFQTRIAQQKNKTDIHREILEYAKAHGLMANQDNLDDETREKFRENLAKIS